MQRKKLFSPVSSKLMVCIGKTKIKNNFGRSKEGLFQQLRGDISIKGLFMSFLWERRGGGRVGLGGHVGT